MKTFATLALLGFASAIKLQQDPDNVVPQTPTHFEEQINPTEFDEIVTDFATFIMDLCDADGDGKCTLEEQEQAFLSDEAFDWESPYEVEFAAKIIDILLNADAMSYWH